MTSHVDSTQIMLNTTCSSEIEQCPVDYVILRNVLSSGHRFVTTWSCYEITSLTVVTCQYCSNHLQYDMFELNRAVFRLISYLAQCRVELTTRCDDMVMSRDHITFCHHMSILLISSLTRRIRVKSSSVQLTTSFHEMSCRVDTAS